MGVSWAETKENEHFNASVQLVARDHVGLIGEIGLMIASMGISISGIYTSTSKVSKVERLNLVLNVKSREQIDRVIKALEARKDIIEVYRNGG